MAIHVCELITADSAKKRKCSLTETWKNCCSVGAKTPKCNLYMDSKAAVSAERRRHADLKYWWIVHPFSYVRFLWEIFMTLVYSIAFFTIPFMICFIVLNYENISLDNVNLPIYILCWIDIFFNCITGYHVNESMEVELQPRMILKNYFKRFLLVDILSSFPYDRITLPWRKLPGNNSVFFIAMINTLPLLKLTRYRTFSLNIHQLFTHFRINEFYYQMFSVILLGIYVMFWFSCLCYLIPMLMMHYHDITTNEYKDSWITQLQERDRTLIFLHAFFIVLENLAASGPGLLPVKTDGHISLSAVLMIFGRLFECYIIIMILQIKAGRKASESKFQEIMNQVTAYTRQKQLPTHMKNRLLAYYQHRFKNSYFREKRILSSLSEQLRQEIAFQSCRRLIENVEIFKNLPKHILQSIVNNLKFELYLPNDVIAKAGSQGNCMFFLSTGTVTVLTPTGKEICHLDDGAHFGEVALLVPDQRRVASVVAIEVCEVYRLDRKDFRRCIAVHTELFASIERIATERVERAIIIEEQHKRHLLPESYIAEDQQWEEEQKRHFV